MEALAGAAASPSAPGAVHAALPWRREFQLASPRRGDRRPRRDDAGVKPDQCPAHPAIAVGAGGESGFSPGVVARGAGQDEGVGNGGQIDRVTPGRECHAQGDEGESRGQGDRALHRAGPGAIAKFL